MNKAEETMDEQLAIIGIQLRNQLNRVATTNAMDIHAINFFDCTIKQGKIKVYYPQEDIEKMYKQFNEEQEEQK